MCGETGSPGSQPEVGAGQGVVGGISRHAPTGRHHTGAASGVRRALTSRQRCWIWAFLSLAAISATRAAGFISSRRGLGELFYAQIGSIETHKPYARFGCVPDRSKGVFVPPYLVDNGAAREDFAGLQGMIRAVDGAVATILRALEEAGHVENTFFAFTVDHGLEVPRTKWACYDPGIKAALIVRWPAGGIADGIRNDWLLSNIDLVPTLLDLIGEPLPANLDGQSFASAFRREERPMRERIFGMYEGAGNRFLRTVRYKPIRSFRPQRLRETPAEISNTKFSAARPPTPYVQLYDLAQDPDESCGVARDPTNQTLCPSSMQPSESGRSLAQRTDADAVLPRRHRRLPGVDTAGLLTFAFP